MLLLKYLLFAIGAGLLLGAVTLIAWDVFAAIQLRRLIAAGGTGTPRHIRLRLSSRLAAIALLPLLLSQSIAIVPSAMAGVRVNQISGAISGPLGPGVHFIAPLVSSVALYDAREHVFTMLAEEVREPQKKETPAAETPKAAVLRVQAKEGLPFGLAIAVRYRLDVKRLEYIHANLPQPIETELVAPAVASAFREVTPNYSVREVFATRREEIREKAAKQIIEKLGADGVLVREVLLRDIVLPAEYAKGLEGLLLKAQESERLAYEIEIKQKQVRTAELEAEADKLRQVKRAEAEAQVRVLQAKGEADATRIRGEAEAAYNQKVAASLTATLIQQRYLERWDGKLPQFSAGGSGSAPGILFNMPMPGSAAPQPGRP